MIKFLYILIILILVSCNTKNGPTNQLDNINSDSIVKLDDSSSNIHLDSILLTPIIDSCNCTRYEKFKKRSYYRTDLRVSRYQLKMSDSIFNHYSNDSLKNTITSIRFKGFDTIPEKFKIFTNVEHIMVESRRDVVGFDLFKNLKSIFFWGSKLKIDTTKKWVKRIEAIYSEKSHISGLTSFKSTPILQEIYFGHALLIPFPNDIDKLKCLRRIELGAYRGKIDLSRIDLSQNPCLEKVEFSTWYDAFTGIPKGLDSTRKFKLIVNHQKLTDLEKLKLNNFNKHTKINAP